MLNHVVTVVQQIRRRLQIRTSQYQGQSITNTNVLPNHLGILSVDRFGIGLRCCFSIKLPGDPDAAGPGPALWVVRSSLQSHIDPNFPEYKRGHMNSHGTRFSLPLPCEQPGPPDTYFFHHTPSLGVPVCLIGTQCPLYCFGCKMLTSFHHLWSYLHKEAL